MKAHPPAAESLRLRKPASRKLTATKTAIRARHLQALALRDVYGITLRILANIFEVSRRTITNWINTARTYEEAESRESLIEFCTRNAGLGRRLVG